MPKRVIDVTCGSNHCRLIESKQLKPQPYIALSYCWGKASNRLFVTTIATIADRETHINVGQLPKALADAVCLTRNLKVKYLWIDALCIIQNDNDDWLEQASQMAEVYKCAYLVIAAASSAASDDSFLQTPNRQLSFSVPFEKDGVSGRVFCMPIRGTGIHENYQGNYGDYDPLFYRGWTLQESNLATRLIVFSSTELQWVCKTHRICEAGHRDSPQHSQSISTNTTRTNAYHYWHIQVMEFTRRRLTYEEDKLPALAGIASETYSITGSAYVGGLWEQNLIYDLCWERFLWESEPHIATKDWYAPTFSWASVRGNVYYNDNGIAGGQAVSYKVTYTDGSTSIGQSRCLTKVLGASCTPISLLNPFGQVAEGFIKVRGPLTQAVVSDHIEAGPGIRYTHVVNYGRASVHLEFRADVPLRQYPTLDASANIAAFGERTAHRARPGENTPVQGAKVWLLNIGSRPLRYNSRRDRPDTWLACIILGRSLCVSGAYERLGYAHAQWPPLGSMWPHRELADLFPFVTGEDTSELLIV